MPELVAGRPGEHINENELMRRFEEKKRLLESTGGHAEAKTIFREVFKKHAEKSVPPPMTAALSLKPVSQPVIAADDDASAQKLQELVALALDQGIVRAVKKAEAETPYLIDALHDELADHYYEKLVTLGKLHPD